MISSFFSARHLAKYFFTLYLLAGLFLFRDIGFSWDEEINRVGTALPEYNFVFHGERDALIKSSEKYHGPSYELLLLSAEHLAGTTDTRSIYFLRHFITFFFFWLSSVFLFLLASKIFRDDRTALFCVLMYVLSPRIFGESFYNSKDLGFLSFFTISLYTMHRFLERKNFLHALMHALVTGFMIDIRITGILIPFITVFAWVADGIIGRDRNSSAKRIIPFIILFLVLQFGCIVLFWPLLWMKPLYYFKEALSQMSSYPWTGQLLFAGKLIRGNMLPWYYIPVWILISIPFLYSLLFLTGVFSLKTFFQRRNREAYLENKYLILFLSAAVLPVAAVILLHSVVYDGWRHVYFVYAPVILVAAYGLRFISGFLRTAASKKILTGILVLQFLFVAGTIISDHPHAHAYFNPLARLIFSPVTENFDADYWGLSYRKALEYLLQNDTSAVIHVRVESDPGVYNIQMLTPEQRKRISIHEDIHEADYWLAEFRGRLIDPQKVNAQFITQIKNSSGPLLTIYKGLRNATHKEVLFQKQLCFDDSSFNKERVSSGAFVSARYSNQLQGSFDASESIDFPLDTILPGEILEVNSEAMVNASRFNQGVLIALTVFRGAESVYWAREDFTNRINAENAWIPVRWNTNIPPIVRPGDVGRIYVWSYDQKLLYVDDLKVRVMKYITAPQK
jgi:hypothetical protein